MLFIKAMKTWHETAGHTLDIGGWSAEVGRSTSNNEKTLLCPLTMPVPFAVPTISHSQTILSLVLSELRGK